MKHHSENITNPDAERLADGLEIIQRTVERYSEKCAHRQRSNESGFIFLRMNLGFQSKCKGGMVLK